MDAKNLENRIKNSYSLIEAVAGFSLASAVLLSIFPQYRPYGFVAGGASVGVYVCSLATKRRVTEASRGFLEDFQKDSLQESQKLSQALQDCETERQHLKSQLEQASKALESLQAESSSMVLVKQGLLRKLEELQEKNAELQVEVDAKVALLKDWGVQAIECWTERLNNLYDHYSKHLECKKRLTQFSEEVEMQSANYLKQLSETSDLGELLATFQALTESFQSLNTRLRKSCETFRYQAKFLEVKALEDEILELQEQHKTQLAKLHADYKSIIQEFQVDYQNFQQTAVDALEQARDTSTYDEFFTKVQSTIAGLTAQLEQAKKPHRFPLTISEHSVGNQLIDFYYKLGVILDACDYERTDTGYKLFFYCDRNTRFVYLDALNSEKINPQIKQIAGALNNPEFKYTERNIRLVLEIQETHAKPKKRDITQLCRSSEEFIKYLLAQPYRFRLIGEPGSGKTPSVVVLISHMIRAGFKSGNTPDGMRLKHLVVEYCNPLDEISVKNGDDLEFCQKWNNASKGFDGLKKEVAFRKCIANTEYRENTGYVWVMDEFDSAISEVSETERQAFMKLLKEGGHVNMGAVVMGQSANVKTSKVSVDDQKMFTNICLDSLSIRTFLEAYGSRFYNESTIKKALETLEELEGLAEEENAKICDSARQTRIAFVAAKRSPVFYRLPYFDSVEFDASAYVETLREVATIKAMKVSQDKPETTQHQAFQTDDDYRETSHSTLSDESRRPSCPHCGSKVVGSKGNKWVCRDSEHQTKAPNKPKEWKK